VNATAMPLLRPMSVAGLLDATIRLYRKNFWTLVAIVAVVQVPVLVVNGLLSVPMSRASEEMLAFEPYTFDPGTYDPSAPPDFMPASFGRYLLWLGLQLLVGGLLGMVATTLMTGALAWAVSERHLDRPIAVGPAYRAVFRRWKSLFGAALLALLIYIGLYVVFLIPCLGQLVGLPALIFAYVCLRFVPQAVMLEGERASGSLRRSWYLTKPHFWRVLGIIALLWLLGLLLTAGPSLIINYGIVTLSPSLILRNLVATGVSAVLSLLYLPIRLTGETLVYYDLRVRQEGLDLEMELKALSPLPEYAEAGEGATLPVEDEQPSLPPASPAREQFLTGRDWRNLGILLAIGFVILLLCCAVYAFLVFAMAALTAPFMQGIIETLPTVTPPP
jgi:hypothetical protein